MIANNLIQELKNRTKWFDVIEITGSSDPVSFKNNRIHSVQHKQNQGYGVRVNVGGTTGFSHTNDKSAIGDTVERAIALSAYGEREEFDLPGKTVFTGEPYDRGIEEYSPKIEIEQAEGIIDSLRSEFDGITIDLGVNRSVSAIRLINSQGFDAGYRTSHYSAGLSATYIFPDGSKVDIWEGMSSARPEPMDTPLKKVREKMSNSLKTASSRSGKMNVLFTPKAFSRLIGILLSGINGRSVHKKISPFADKLGRELFHRGLTIADNPAIKDSPYSFPFDDEGVPASNKVLIREGRISCFITDLKYASLLGLPPTGNGSRGYSSLPSPSFSNIIIGEGTVPVDDLMSGMDRGLLVDQFIGLGQSNTLTGDFSAALDLAFIMDKMEIAGRVKDCMITENLFRLLAGEFTLSSEREQQGSMLVPYAFFPKVNITC